MSSLSLAPIKEVHQNIIWPAVAGNVAWALLTLVIQPSGSSTDYWPRVILLAILTIYLLRSWRQLKVNQETPWYYFLDTVYAVAIALLAISISSSEDHAQPWVTRSLYTMFGSLLVGHLTCSWYKYQSKWGSGILALLNAGALCAVYSSVDLPEPRSTYLKVVTLTVVLVVWWVVMRLYPPSEAAPAANRSGLVGISKLE